MERAVSIRREALGTSKKISKRTLWHRKRTWRYQQYNRNIARFRKRLGARWGICLADFASDRANISALPAVRLKRTGCCRPVSMWRLFGRARLRRQPLTRAADGLKRKAAAGADGTAKSQQNIAHLDNMKRK